MCVCVQYIRTYVHLSVCKTHRLPMINVTGASPTTLISFPNSSLAFLPHESSLHSVLSIFFFPAGGLLSISPLPSSSPLVANLINAKESLLNIKELRRVLRKNFKSRPWNFDLELSCRF